MLRQAGAGGLFGHHGPTEEKWTEEFQSALAAKSKGALLFKTSVATCRDSY